MNTLPADEQEQEAAADHIIIQPSVKLQNGAVYIHKDLVQVAEPWADEGHIGPIEESYAFGDIASLAAYVKKYHGREPLITWNNQGIEATLDYHYIDEEENLIPNNATWHARYPFVETPQWKAWRNFATGHGWAQAKAVEFLEDHAEDIVEPEQSVLLTLLRNLRGSANATASTELRPDGTASVNFSSDRRVAGSPGSVELPAEITIAIPVIKGHQDIFKLVLRLRVSVDANAHLELRFSMPQAEVVLEQVYDELVARAREELGEGFTVLRAAD